MKILVACEESQAVTIELRKLGHEAYSCDIIECSGGHPEWHIMQDVLPLLHPHNVPLWDGSTTIKGIDFKTCDGIENPIGYANTHYRKPNQIIQPWHFGHPYTKATCLWLNGLQPLVAEVNEKPEGCKSYAWETMIDERGKTISWDSALSKKLRSKTFPGIAKAMAEQWAGKAVDAE